METAPEMKTHIRDFRRAKGWSQQKLAEELKVAVATVARWEAGRTQPSELAREALQRIGWES